jgi:hypothetical protein
MGWEGETEVEEKGPVNDTSVLLQITVKRVRRVGEHNHASRKDDAGKDFRVSCSALKVLLLTTWQ